MKAHYPYCLTRPEGRDAARLAMWRLCDIAEELAGSLVSPQRLGNHYATVLALGEALPALPDPDQRPERSETPADGFCGLDHRAAEALRESAHWAIRSWGSWIEEMARDGELRPAHHEHCRDKVDTARRVLLALHRTESEGIAA